MTVGPLMRPGSTAHLDAETLADHAAIKDVTAAYGHYYDSGDFDGLRELFTEDVRYEFVPETPPFPGRVAGREDVMRALVEQWRHNRNTLGAYQRHVTTNIVVLRHRDATAETRSLLTVTFAYEDGRHEVRRTGGYADVLRKEDGRWRFARRQLRFAGLLTPGVPLTLE